MNRKMEVEMLHPSYFGSRLKTCWLKIQEFQSYGIVFILTLALYFLSAGPTSGQSSTPQYVYLAYTLLQGKLHLVKLPSILYDLILYKGYWYVPEAIAPALVLLPFVAIWGLSVGDIWFGMVVGAINTVLVYDLLGMLNDRADFPHNVEQSTRIWLTVLFTAGTAHWYISSLGSIWFNAQVLAVTFMLLFVRETMLDKRAWLVGIWLSLAVLSRPSTVFGALFYVTYILMQYKSRRQAFLKLVPVAIFLGLTICGMGVYNYLRFHSPFDFGYGYVQGSAPLMAAYSEYGGFNPRYFPCGFYISMFGIPNIMGNIAPGIKLFCGYILPFGKSFENSWAAIPPIGMSIFFVTPAFVYIFKAHSRQPLVVAAWVGSLAVLFPLWMYHNTGAVQYGYRYVLDFIAFIMILLAAGMQERINFLEKLTIGTSIFANFAGMLWMSGRFYAGNNFIWMWISTIGSFFHIKG